MAWEDVKSHWAAKLEQLEAAGAELELPHASNVILLLFQLRPEDPEALGALSFLMRTYPDELPLECGAAGCRPLDRAFFDAYAASAGSDLRGLRSLEAVLLATDEALYYVSPHAQQYRRWPWSETHLRSLKRKRVFARLEVETADRSFKFRLAATVMDNLLTVYAWSRAQSNTRRYHVGFGGGPGVTFTVSDAGDESISWRYDPGLPDNVDSSILVDCALSELEVALGRPPSGLNSESPFYIPDWTPPLPR